MVHTYNVGTDVFCFEPDETKEKLIYKARILEQSGYETYRNVKTPLYRVHFLGWNKKWDRIVPQTLMLPNIVFYEDLKEMIDKIVREKMHKQLRHDLIDTILEFASNVTNEKKTKLSDVEPKLEKIKKLFVSNQSKKLNSSSISHTTDSNSVLNYAESSISNNQSKSITNINTSSVSILDVNNNTPGKSGVGSDKLYTQSTSSLQQSLLNLDADGTVIDKLLNKQNDSVHRSFMPSELSLTNKQLEFLKKADRKPSSKLIDYTVCEILQMYLDSFPHTACIPPTTHQKTDINELSLQYQKADLNRKLAYEVCIGLRTLFDAYCPVLLLTTYEKAHNSHIDKVNHISSFSHNVPFPHRFSVYPQFIQSKMHQYQPPCYSLVYGYQHLLRLLFLLPKKILPQLSFPSLSHQVILYRHLNFIIHYLDKQNDVFTKPVNNKRKFDATDEKLSVLQPKVILIRTPDKMSSS